MTYFSEPISASAETRKNYRDGIQALIRRRAEELETLRHQKLTPRDMKAIQPMYREKLKKMLGWPLTGPVLDPDPRITRVHVADEEGVAIDRITLEILDGVPMTALLFTPTDLAEGEKIPGVLCQHGGAGTPELISGLWGDTHNYNQMLRRVLEKRVVVIAPQLLLWRHPEEEQEFMPPFDRPRTDAALRQLGGTLTALEIYGLQRMIDYLAALPQVDESRLGMVGLSYGGFYTLLTAAIDTRLKAAVSSCSFNSHACGTIPDWCFQDAALKLMNGETAALVAPRALAIEVGKADELFDYKEAIREAENIPAFFEAFGAADKLLFRVFDGPHEFSNDPDSLEFFFKHL
ncbi:MAG: dienelactone hydrolase family protein [Clostridia bacterium]|nr:dienelactone hydrolase family protein [Clostridia bacterium]